MALACHGATSFQISFHCSITHSGTPNPPHIPSPAFVIIVTIVILKPASAKMIMVDDKTLSAEPPAYDHIVHDVLLQQQQQTSSFSSPPLPAQEITVTSSTVNRRGEEACYPPAPYLVPFTPASAIGPAIFPPTHGSSSQSPNGEIGMRSPPLARPPEQQPPLSLGAQYQQHRA